MSGKVEMEKRSFFHSLALPTVVGDLPAGVMDAEESLHRNRGRKVCMWFLGVCPELLVRTPTLRKTLL